MIKTITFGKYSFLLLDFRKKKQRSVFIDFSVDFIEFINNPQASWNIFST